MGLTYIKSRFLHPVKMKWYDLQIEIIGAWKFFLKRQRSGERKLTKIHYQSTDKICETSGLLSFIWPTDTLGMADWLTG